LISKVKCDIIFLLLNNYNKKLKVGKYAMVILSNQVYLVYEDFVGISISIRRRVIRQGMAEAFRDSF